MKNISTQWSRLINENAISQTKFTDNSSTTHEPPASMKHSRKNKTNETVKKINTLTHTHIQFIYNNNTKEERKNYSPQRNNKKNK